MPTPIAFSVPAARRSGTFDTAAMTMPEGYTLLRWTLAIPKVAEYEDPGNSFRAEVHAAPPGGVDGIYQSAGWAGGRVVSKGVTDPAPTIAVGVDDIPVGSSVFVRVSVPVAMTIGIDGTLG
jgi:hypothetical protein